MGEDICKLYILYGVNIQNIQRTHTTQHQKKKKIKNWAEDLNRHLSKEDILITSDTLKDAQHH